MKLTEALIQTNQRVGALESQDFDENAGIARITKLYGNVKITATIRATLHAYPVCSETLYCSDTLII